ncbi:non-heme iron oxygenase ferredoxin subunit [Mycobacterium genavense]|uniref:non-heme iron oxygenase ferredoxin subunit n=1 Tax=Mycobacterium genavense TaxID=36812 RepID=UPI0004B5E435|nr:non-heme iron oxygenase ferredoxin subunit [Mycobacterium genavense]
MSVENTRGCKLVKVADYSDLVDKQPIAVDVGSDEVMLVRIADVVYAISNICSHADAWLDAGQLHLETLEIECPLHEVKFHLRTGDPTAEPCTDPVRKYDVVIDGDEVFVVTVDDD